MKEVLFGGLFPALPLAMLPPTRAQATPPRPREAPAALSGTQRPLERGGLTRPHCVRVGRSLDHPVGLQEYRLRNRDAERLGRFQIDHQFELAGLFDRQVSGLGSLKNLV